MNLTGLHAFCLVAETGTISAAATRLGVPKSTVSRRVSRLEDALGLELLRRSPRAVSLTEHGAVLHQRSAASIRELQEATRAVASSDREPSGHLRLTTVPGFGHEHGFVRCVRDFGLKYPKITTHLELTTRLVDLIEEDFDIGIRLHAGDLPGSATLMSRRLVQMERGLYASRAYIAEMGLPVSPGDLADHRLVAHAIVDAGGHHLIRHEGLGGETAPLPAPRWLINDSTALERFALSGAGLALLSTIEGERSSARGDLVRVLPEYKHRGAIASLIWPASRHLAPRVRAFIDHAVEAFAPAVS